MASSGARDQGRDYDNRYSMIFETEAGQVTAVREYTDTAAARRALFPAQKSE